MSTPIRALRSAQGLAAQAPKTSTRRLHITGAYSQPSSIGLQQRAADSDRKAKPAPGPTKDNRPFNTHSALQKAHDSSTIDFVYFPQADAPDLFAQTLAQTPLIPLLPDQSAPARAEHPLLVGTDPVHRPQISTNEADGLAEGRVAAMSEADGGVQADSGGVIGMVGNTMEKGSSELKRVWNGMLDDLLGPTARPA